MHSENLFIDDSSNGKTVEAIRKRLPELDVVTPLAFVVKAINAIYTGAFMITPENKEILGILDLVCQ